MRRVALLCLVTFGCASSPLTLKQSPRTYSAKDYRVVYDRWTRKADRFSVGGLSDVLHATATFQSWEFRWAYVVRFASDHSLAMDARVKMLKASLDEAKQKHRFFVTMVGDSYVESDLTKDTSAWRVLLVNPKGEHVVPVELAKVRRPTATEKRYYPSISPFRQTFRISFPVRRADGSPTIAPSDSHVTLRFAGAAGKVDLRWDLSYRDG